MDVLDTRPTCGGYERENPMAFSVVFWSPYLCFALCLRHNGVLVGRGAGGGSLRKLQFIRQAWAFRSCIATETCLGGPTRTAGMPDSCRVGRTVCTGAVMPAHQAAGADSLPAAPCRLALLAGQVQAEKRILPSGLYSIRLEQGRAGCNFRGEQGFSLCR